MQKIVALVALRKLPRGGSNFRRWFVRQVCRVLRRQQQCEAMAFYNSQAPSVYYDVCKRNAMFQLLFCVPMSTHRTARRSDLRLQYIKNRSGYNHWEWRRKLQQRF